MPRPVHFEIFGDDPERLADFYAAAFGWRVEKWAGQPYWLVYTGEGEPGIDGAVAPSDENRQAVVLTMQVDDLDAARAKVEAAGGQLLTDNMPIPGVGFFFQARDPAGNTFGIMTPETGGAA